MLREIRLELFKCFRSLRLPLAPFTLLSGTNASGKSTIIQALVLLHQTAIDTRWGTDLLLDGSVLSLGTLGDVIDKANGRRSFSFGLSAHDFDCTWTFESGAGRDDLRTADREDIAVPLRALDLRAGTESLIARDSPPIPLMPEHASEARRRLVELIEDISYISAERSGPRETYPLFDARRHRTVGPRGDLAPGKLFWYEDHEVVDRLRHEGETAPTLPRQTQAWLADFFPGASFEVQRIPRANLVTLGLRTSSDTDHHRPQHVGFGLTHVLPILVACLHARPGDVVIIENPEVHLHPMGQAKMGLFLSKVAHGGVQVIVETHSDHVLNGVRRAVKTSVLAPDDAALHFFQPRAVAEAKGESQVISPRLDLEGNIDRWPDGFFDQFERDMSYFAGLDE